MWISGFAAGCAVGMFATGYPVNGVTMLVCSATFALLRRREIPNG